MEHLLYDIINRIGTNMPEIRTIDEDYGQLQMLEQEGRDSYPLVFPAILIDAPETQWENIGGLSQKGVCTFSVKLCIDCYDDTHYRSNQIDMILIRDKTRRELHRLLQGHRIGNGSALIRTSSRFYTASYGIKVYESTYAIEVTECLLPEKQIMKKPTITFFSHP